MTSENKESAIVQLAKNIAADINRLDRTAPKEGGLKDPKSVNLSPLLNGAVAKNLKGVTDQLKKTAGEASDKNQAEVEKVSGEIENSLKVRQTKIASDLEELNKTDIKDSAGGKIILNRISKDVDLSSRRISEIQINKTVINRNIIGLRSISLDK